MKEPRKLDYEAFAESSPKKARMAFRIIAGIAASLIWSAMAVGLYLGRHRVGGQHAADWIIVTPIILFAIGMTSIAIRGK